MDGSRVYAMAMDGASGTFFLGQEIDRKGRLTAYDVDLRARWTAPLTFVPQDALALGPEQVILFGRDEAGANWLALVDHGAATKVVPADTLCPGAQIAFSPLFGRAPNGAPQIGVSCTKDRNLLKRFTLGPDLAPTDAIPWMMTQQATDGAEWELANDARAIVVTRNRSGDPYFRQVLGQADAQPRSTVWRALTLVGSDALVAGSVRNELPALDGLGARWSSQGFVTRLGAGHAWTTELFREPDAVDPTKVGAPVATPDGAVLVALEVGEGGSIGGAELPAVGIPGVPFPNAIGSTSIAELDGGTGALRSVTVFRTKEVPSFYDNLRFAANATNVFLRHGYYVTVHPRKGRPIAAGTAAPPPRPTLVPMTAASDATGVVLTAAWSELCGTRVASKGNAPCRITHLSVGKDGTVAAGGGYYQASQLGERKLGKAAYETGLLAVYAPNGKLRFQKTFGVSWHNDLMQVLVRDDGAIVAIGVHGQGFSIDGKTLPAREVPKIAGQDMGFEANTPFFALFDPNGKLLALRDLDEMIHGRPSTDYRRRCWTEVAQGAAPDLLEATATCGLGESALPDDHPERGPYRFRIRGAEVEGVARFPAGLVPTHGWKLAPDGSAYAATSFVAAPKLLALVSGRELEAPLPYADGRPFALLPNGLLVTGRVDPIKSPATLLVTTMGRDLSNVAPRILGSGTRATVMAVAVDDRHRPVLAVSFVDALTVAGRTIDAAPKLPDQSARTGLVFVRLSQDGTTVERVMIPKVAAGTCSDPARGELTDFGVRGGVLALTFSFGVTAGCVKDEPSTVMGFAMPD
jgi:hypothetical protein